MGIDNVTILMNGLEFRSKNPKRRLDPLEHEEIKVSRRIANNKDLYDDLITDN
jgi:hypothetical protein